MKKTKITELLNYIEDRLQELEEEKEELRVYYDLDRTRRCLEYTIYQREHNDVNEELERLEEDYVQRADVTNQQYVASSDRETAILEASLFKKETTLFHID
jgi:structural maintenance of chromosome 3 (chondroitin sulfate proteoglycan 6)